MRPLRVMKAEARIPLLRGHLLRHPRQEAVIRLLHVLRLRLLHHPLLEVADHLPEAVAGN